MTFDERNRRSVLAALALFLPVLANGEDAIDWSQMPDFGALRLQVGGRTDFYRICESSDEPDSNRQIVEYLEVEDWEAAARSARARLQNCPVDIETHSYAGYALERLDRVPEAQQHIDWYNGLLDSVLDSGDGRTADTAFVTISVREEYAVIRAFRLTPKSQSLVGNRDLFVVTDETGEELEIYFFPELHWKRMEEMFSQ